MISVSPSDKDTVTVRKGGWRGSWGSRGGVGGGGGGDGGTGHGYALGISRAGYWLEWWGGGGGVEEGRVVKVTCLGMTLVIHYRFFFCSDDFSN